MTEQYETATAATEAFLRVCLPAKGIQDLSQISVGVHGETDEGDWHPV